MKCPVCKKEFDENTGRRPKRFCSDGCKVKFWNAAKRLKTPQIQDFNQNTEQVPDLTKEPPKSNYALTAMPPMPERKDFADNWDYIVAKNEWKKLYNQ